MIFWMLQGAVFGECRELMLKKPCSHFCHSLPRLLCCSYICPHFCDVIAWRKTVSMYVTFIQLKAPVQQHCSDLSSYTYTVNTCWTSHLELYAHTHTHTDNSDNSDISSSIFFFSLLKIGSQNLLVGAF